MPRDDLPGEGIARIILLILILMLAQLIGIGWMLGMFDRMLSMW